MFVGCLKFTWGGLWILNICFFLITEENLDLPEFLVKITGVAPGRLVTLLAVQLAVPGKEHRAAELLHLQRHVQRDRDDVVEDDKEGEEILEDDQGGDLAVQTEIPVLGGAVCLASAAFIRLSSKAESLSLIPHLEETPMQCCAWKASYW